HAMIALNNGSNVLCEKPIVPTLQDAQELHETAIKCGKMLAIGFQWSFSEVMTKIKEDMAKGDFGKPLEFSTMVSWCRARDYYQKGWTGQVKSAKDGQWLLDSIVSNATAHYLHNMLFLLGDKPDSAMEIAQCDAAIYRANSIESFDTCFLRGKTENGAGISYCVAHPTYVNREPKLRYRFENADITMNVEDETSIVRAYFKDGTVREYGNPQTDADKAFKLTKTIAAINGEGEIPCNALTCIPHLRVSNALFDMVDIIDYPKEFVHVDEDRNLIYVDGVYEALLECFEHFKLPSELGANFAKEETYMDLRGYNSFSGERLEKAREEK
ncbi:MAG TPA: Gfo/Idh/MocA family oxidoreductase, partial [Oscillospiraceae bacterium]|nr:Gfo/Idh/MocA family oxidoreductase [Oscillospiraceae bacterium]